MAPDGEVAPSGRHLGQRSLLWRPPLAGLWLRPWYDRLATWGVARLHLPMSRAWAEADAEAGAAAEALAAAEAAWLAGFFAPVPPPDNVLMRLDSTRRRCAARWMWRRLRHPAAALSGPPAGFAIAGPAESEAAHAARRDGQCAAYPPSRAAVEISHPLSASDRTRRWLRFPAADGGSAWARLDRPHAPPRGTLIGLHGICIEEDFWPPVPDYTAQALASGWQVLRPEAPWHGRRRRPGTYGGEPLIAGGPKAFLDFFALAVPELAVWTRWARTHGPVAWSGFSLGALTAQLGAEAASHWSAELRPDGLLLVATAGHLAQAAIDGSLGRMLGLRSRLAAAGWTETELARWAPLLDPAGPCPLPAERIQVVLGSRDELLPFAQGAALVRRWGLPVTQVTVRRQGHFSVSLGLLAEPQPMLAVLQGLA